MKTLRCGVMAAVILILAVSGARGGEMARQLSQESIIEKIQKEGILRVGMSTFVPWAMKDKHGELIGFEIDVARKLAEDMGVAVEFVPTAWSGIIPALLTGKFDVIIGGMGITPERNLKVNFTNPYDYSGMSLVAHKEKAQGFASLADFNSPQVTLAVRMGTTAEQAARKFMPQAEFKLFENESQALQELNLGRVHAVVSMAPMPVFHALKHPDKLFVPISENFTREPVGFALRKGDCDALNYFNNWITLQEASGFLAEKKAWWFESSEWEDLVK
jgi:polar amino acid transport system substrate-binding protein